MDLSWRKMVAQFRKPWDNAVPAFHKHPYMERHSCVHLALWEKFLGAESCVRLTIEGCGWLTEGFGSRSLVWIISSVMARKDSHFRASGFAIPNGKASHLS